MGIGILIDLVFFKSACSLIIDFLKNTNYVIFTSGIDLISLIFTEASIFIDIFFLLIMFTLSKLVILIHRGIKCGVIE